VRPFQPGLFHLVLHGYGSAPRFDPTTAARVSSSWAGPAVSLAFGLGRGRFGVSLWNAGAHVQQPFERQGTVWPMGQKVSWVSLAATVGYHLSRGRHGLTPSVGLGANTLTYTAGENDHNVEFTSAQLCLQYDFAALRSEPPHGGRDNSLLLSAASLPKRPYSAAP